VRTIILDRPAVATSLVGAVVIAIVVPSVAGLSLGSRVGHGAVHHEAATSDLHENAIRAAALGVSNLLNIARYDEECAIDLPIDRRVVASHTTRPRPQAADDWAELGVVVARVFPRTEGSAGAGVDVGHVDRASGGNDGAVLRLAREQRRGGGEGEEGEESGGELHDDRCDVGWKLSR